MNWKSVDITKLKESHGNWDKYITRCDEVTEFEGDDKENAQKALQYLRSVLGEGFLRRAIEQGHPLFSILLYNTRIMWLQLTRFAEALGALGEAQGFNEVLRRIKKPTMFAEGSSVLDVALHFFRAGFKVTFNPRVTVTLQDGKKKSRVPDLMIVNEETGEELIIEVTNSEMGAAFKESFDISKLSLPLFAEVLQPAKLVIHAQLSEAFDDAQVEKAFRQIEALSDEVVRTGEFRALVNDYIEVGIAPDDNREELSEWAAERSIAAGIGGPPIWFDEISRMSTKIRDKLAQLPENRPGFIVITATSTMLFHYYDIELISKVLNEEICRFAKLNGVILLRNHLGVGRNVAVNLDLHKVLNSNIAGPLQRQAIILLNEVCTLPLTDITREKLQKAFAI